MEPTLSVYSDVPAFYSDVRGHLEAREGEHALLLGFLSRLAQRPPAEAPFLARAHVGNETVGVAYLTALNLIVSRGIRRAAGPLAEALRDRGLEIPGIVGLKEDVEALTAAWGVPPTQKVEQMLYELRTVVWPTGIPGRMRAMTEADVDLVTDWILGFYRAALAHEPFSEAQARENAAARPAQGMTYMWEVAGAPVAMAALARPTEHGISVNSVYTPPEHRRHGYASALVAALSQEGLDRGKDFCVLYTDLSNPTSNAIYRKIGYTPISASQSVRFD